MANTDFRAVIKAILDTSNIQVDISELEKELAKKKINLQAVINTSSNKKVLQNHAAQIQEIFKQMGVDIDISKITSSLNQVYKQVETVASKANKIQLSIDTGAYSSKVADLISKTNQWTDVNGDARISTTALTETLNNLNTASSALSSNNTVANQETLISTEKELDAQIKTVTNSIKQMKVEWATDSEISSLNQKIQEFYDKNTASHKTWGAQLKQMLFETANGAELTREQIDKIEQEFVQVGNAARQAGRLGSSWFDTIKSNAQSYLPWVSTTGMIMKAVTTAKEMYNAVYNIDTEMTELYKVTDETDSRYTKFLTNACSNAKELGRTVSSLIEQTANWSKLGYSIDQAEELSKISSIYVNVGEVDDDTAVSDLVTAMKAFNIEASDSITIVDSLNKLGNEFATDAASLGEGLKNSASALSVAGNDINQTLAMLTGGGEITQDVGNLGNALKVVSLRLRGMKGALQEIGEEYEDIEDISKIQTQIYNLSKGKVNIFNDDGTFKSTYEQLKEISEIYFELSDPDRADLTEIMFGKNRANQGIAILQAFQSGQIQKAYEASVKSAGSAYEEQERWMGSLEAKTAQFEVAFQSLSNTIVDSDVLKWFVDFGTGTVSALDAVIDKTGILLPILSGTSIVEFIKNLDHQKVLKICLDF